MVFPPLDLPWTLWHLERPSAVHPTVARALTHPLEDPSCLKVEICAHIMSVARTLQCPLSTPFADPSVLGNIAITPSLSSVPAGDSGEFSGTVRLR